MSSSNSSGGEIGSFCLGRISHVPDLASGILITVLMCCGSSVEGL